MTTEITEVIDASIDDAVNSKSTLTATVPRSYLPVDLDTVHEVGFERGIEGELFRGYVADIIESIDEQGTHLATLVCAGTEVELEWANTGRGLVIRNKTPAQALTLLLADTSWTYDLEGTGYVSSITRRYNNVTIMDALKDLASILGAYLTFDSSARIVTINNAPTASGITLVSLPATKPSHDYGYIREIKDIESDRSQLVNRIISEAKSDDDRIITLQSSSRTTPYTIQSVFKVPPSIVEWQGFDGTVENGYGGDVEDRDGNTTFNIGNILCDGDNRAVLIFTRAGHFSSASEIPLVAQVTVGGKPAEVLFQQAHPRDDTAYTDRIGMWICVNPPKGNVAIAGVKSLNCGLALIAISLQDVDQDEPYDDFDSDYDSSGTAHSVSLAGATTDDLLIAGAWGYESDISSIVSTNGDNFFNDVQGLNNWAFSRMRNVSGTQVFTFTSGASNPVSSMGIVIQPQYQYYIEDTDSQDDFGIREKILNLGSYKGYIEDGDTLENAANTIYDRTRDYLEEYSTPKISYDIGVSWIPQAPATFKVGQSLIVDTTQVAETLLVPQRRQIFLPDGTREWDLRLSTKNKFRDDFINEVQEISLRVETIQNNQV